jgi:hypothetical protein
MTKKMAMEISIYREQKTEILLYSGVFLIQNTGVLD